MGEITERKIMGWYGRCPECNDLKLADFADRYSIEAIYRIGETGLQWDTSWKPGSPKDESEYGGAEKWDADHNPAFTSLECGNAYFILNSKENKINLPNFEKEGGFVIDECCGDKPLEVAVHCRCDKADCSSMDITTCKGWNIGELPEVCARLGATTDITTWMEPQSMWWDPLVQNYLGSGTQLHASESDAVEKKLPDTSGLIDKGLAEYVYIKLGDKHVFVKFDETGKIVDTRDCEFDDLTIFIKTCKHDDYGWILMAKEGSAGQYRPIYTGGDLSEELMPGSTPIEVVDLPAGWTHEKTGDYIGELDVVTAVTDIWGSAGGGIQYLKIKDSEGNYQVAYYHTDDNPVGTSAETCSSPAVSNTSKTTIATKNLFCFDGTLNDGTKKCELPTFDCCSGLQYTHTVSTDVGDYTLDDGSYDPEQFDSAEDWQEFFEKYLEGADSPGKQCCDDFGWMEIASKRGLMHDTFPKYDVNVMCHDFIASEDPRDMGSVGIQTNEVFEIMFGGEGYKVTLTHGDIGFSQECCGRVVVKLNSGDCLHGCVKPEWMLEAEGLDAVWFIPVDEPLDCDCESAGQAPASADS